jgi:hypothetical protein
MLNPFKPVKNYDEMRVKLGLANGLAALVAIIFYAHSYLWLKRPSSH